MHYNSLFSAECSELKLQEHDPVFSSGTEKNLFCFLLLLLLLLLMEQTCKSIAYCSIGGTCVQTLKTTDD